MWKISTNTDARNIVMIFNTIVTHKINYFTVININKQNPEQNTN